MKVGDRVIVRLLNSPHNGQSGTISAQLVLLGTNAFDVKLDTGKIKDFYDYQLELHSGANSPFKVGDRVKVITPNYVGYGKEATITKIQANAFIELLLDGSLAPIYGYEDKNLELLPPPIVYTPNPFTHLIPITGQPSQYRRVGDTFSVTIGDYEPSNSHTHNWKFYQGLNSRFEFCTVCDQKRDTDKRA